MKKDSDHELKICAPNDGNKDIEDSSRIMDISGNNVDNSTEQSRQDFEGSINLLDNVFLEEINASRNNIDAGQGSPVTPTAPLSTSKRIMSRKISERVLRFNAKPSVGNLLSPMQSLVDSLPASSSHTARDQSLVSEVVKRHQPKKKLENIMKNFEGNFSNRQTTKEDLRTPKQIKELINNDRLEPILDRYEQLSEQESQQRHEIAAKIAAKERHRRLGCTKSKVERGIFLKQSRAQFLITGKEENMFDNTNKTGTKNDILHEEVRAVQYDFTNFVPPIFKKSDIERQLIMEVMEQSFVFSEFRKYGKARCEGALDMLIEAFEPVVFPPSHILLHQGVTKKNDEFYILEAGKIDFHKDGRPSSQMSKAGDYFGELSLLYEIMSDKMISSNESSSKETKLLKINQKTYRGILKNCSNRAARERRDALLGVDFLFDLINENDNMINRLTSIMTREELEVDDTFNFSQDKSFVVIQSGTMNITSANQLLNSGDYFGSRALIGTLPRQHTNVIDMVACSEKVVLFKIDNHAMGRIIGQSQLQNLMDMSRFASCGMIKNAQLSNNVYESMASKISEKNFCKDEESTWEIEKDAPPAVYLVREGALVVSSYDDSTGGEIETLVTAGNVFGDKQLELSTENNQPVYQRVGGLKALVQEGISASVGVLPLDDVQPESTDCSKTATNDMCKIDDNDVNETEGTKSRCSVSPTLERAKVREVVQRNSRLEDLEKIRLLGEGQFGEVWLVAANLFPEGNPAARQKFALKSQFKEDDGRGMDAKDAILKEIEIMKILRHPQLVDLVNTYEDDTCIHMLMRLIPHGELWSRIHIEDDEGNWSSGLVADHAKFYAMSIADTLNFMHSRGIIYRDLKPENVLIDKEGYPVLVDFGFAKFCPDKTYTFVGTPNYVAPEVITNAGHNRGVDFWAYGVTVYEMVTGENPFFYEGLDQVSLYDTICREEHFPLPEDEDKGLVDFIDKLLKKDPIERLGMLRGGIDDVLKHEWFDDIKLTKIQAKTFPAPWKPTGFIDDGFESVRLQNQEFKPIDNSSVTMSNDYSLRPLSNTSPTQEPVEDKGRIEDRYIPSNSTRKTTKMYPLLNITSTQEPQLVEDKGRIEDQDTPSNSTSKTTKMRPLLNTISTQEPEPVGDNERVEDQHIPLNSTSKTNEMSPLPNTKSPQEIEPVEDQCIPSSSTSRTIDTMRPLLNVISTSEIKPVEDLGLVEDQGTPSSSTSIPTKKKKKSRKSKKKSKDSNKKDNDFMSTGLGSISEFHFVTTEYALPQEREPITQRSPTRKRQSQIRRDLLESSFGNFDID